MRRIMLIDDDAPIRDSITILLQRSGYEVAAYPDGNILLQPFSVPDLFILDKELPGIDGLDLCRLLKEREETRHIPVIMLSASPYITQLAMRVRADRVLEKPFPIQQLKDTVAKLLTR